MAMGTNAFSTLILFSFFLFIAPSFAFNITQILEGFPDFSGFNSLLSQANLPDPISHRGTVTVLAVDGSGLGPTKGLSPDVLKRVLSVHVVLDFYDDDKIQNMKEDSVTLTTLYQTTGTADRRQGFLNMSKVTNQIKLGSAMPGSPLNSELIKVVVTKPYNLSVLQVSSIIVPPGIEKAGTPSGSPPPPAKAPSAASSPPPAPAADAPEANSPTADAPEADAPAADKRRRIRPSQALERWRPVQG